MKKTAIVLVIVMTAMLITPLLEADTDKVTHGKKIQAKAASFKSDSLNDDPAKMKDIAKALGAQKGILAAKLDKETRMLNIVFDPAKASIETIEEALGTQLKDFERKELKDIEWAPKDCGKCPSASKCASKDKE